MKRPVVATDPIATSEHASAAAPTPVEAAPAVGAPQAPSISQAPEAPTPTPDEPAPALATPSLAVTEGQMEASAGPGEEPSPAQETPDPALPATTGTQAQQDTPLPSGKPGDRQRFDRSPIGLASWLDTTLRSISASPEQEPTKGQGRIKHTLTFPEAVYRIIESTGRKPGTLVAEAAEWILSQEHFPPQDLREVGDLIAKLRKRKYNPKNINYPVTLNITGKLKDSIDIASKRFRLEPAPLFEAATVAYARTLAPSALGD